MNRPQILCRAYLQGEMPFLKMATLTEFEPDNDTSRNCMKSAQPLTMQRFKCSSGFLLLFRNRAELRGTSVRNCPKLLTSTGSYPVEIETRHSNHPKSDALSNRQRHLHPIHKTEEGGASDGSVDIQVIFAISNSINNLSFHVWFRRRLS